jgi:hypothetical protein
MTSGANKESKIVRAALSLYRELVRRASKRETISYSEASAAIDWGGPNLMGRPLGLLGRWCEAKSYPRIDVLVVTEATGLPSDKARYLDPKGEIQKAHEFDWSKVGEPEPKELD